MVFFMVNLLGDGWLLLNADRAAMRAAQAKAKAMPKSATTPLLEKES
jgi:hypothetical protein